MASHELSPNGSTLYGRLELVLPRGACFNLHHVSTPPERTEALRPASQGGRPEKTYCESHFLTVSVQPRSEYVLAFAIEVFVYSTASSTTFFVSKADSTGYLHLLNLPKGISPIKEISAVFLQYLIDNRQRPGITSIVSLFARAQDQYLFPGSIENDGKHVLDDRGLVKWWCRVLDPLVKDTREDVQAHLLVPGLDKYESTGLLPPDKRRWTVGHPLEELFGRDLPPRCVIPHFPDDPKARYLDELDNEIEGTTNEIWKSVKSLDQFWEMMAFRQECSAGRMVGFIWVVLRSKNAQLVDGVINDNNELDEARLNIGLMTPSTSFHGTSAAVQSTDLPRELNPANSSSLHSKRRKIKLRGPIVTRQPKIKTEHRQYHQEKPERTAYYVWPLDSRGEVVVDEKEYKRITELLLRLDFANINLAISSSRRWVDEVKKNWGHTVVGTKVVEERASTASGIATLNMGLLKKKRTAEPSSQEPVVNTLDGLMIRKKAKP